MDARIQALLVRGEGLVTRRDMLRAARASAVTALESALHRPDDADGGYPLVPVTDKANRAPVQVLAVDDLPRAYRELGRRPLMRLTDGRAPGDGPLVTWP
ncbi:hypothetical protein [Micromonospora sp. NPDC005220]|uniref:hypothetical protein n=1 Tax=Micromonospora sp. NPDC005220 TaxID=3155589 RepID=UPI0033A8C331